ncbi:ester cyclase [Candidatus Poriferisodalis sp.]|uniref:ester cyclase n=1 Tax=Candidatus Poriferisodalis sp. TaxID=3101277 RepID=UPI003B023E9D
MAENIHGHVQRAKSVVLDYHRAIDGVLAHPRRSGGGAADDIVGALASSTAEGFLWRGMHPFYEQHGADAVAEAFWAPLHAAMAPLQRRMDVFLAGDNDADGGATTWVCSMGHFVGLFDAAWLDIPPTRRVMPVRYVEFNRVEGDRIAESALFVDLIAIMRQAGHYPLPPATGQPGIYLGPRTADGVLAAPQDPDETAATLELAWRMAGDLDEANRIAGDQGSDRMPREVLARCWHDDMLWIGPDGIGSSYTIDRYQQQHSYPFRFGLGDKEFHGHVARIAEGCYAAWFGWANVTNRPRGGYLGLPASDRAEMRVVDVYRREGDKLADNWVFIDLLHWLSQQGLQPLERMRQLLGIEEF